MALNKQRKEDVVVGLVQKPDFDRCMERINAWYECEIVDRVPVRFSAHNVEYSEAMAWIRNIGATGRSGSIRSTRWKPLFGL